MKTLPETKEEWIGLVLFPFKSYVAMGLPFLFFCHWIKYIIQFRFYGYPEEAAWCVSAGYVLCLAVLLPGALVQAIVCRGNAAVRTLVFVVIGFVFLLGTVPPLMGR